MGACSNCSQEMPGTGFAFCPFCGAAVASTAGREQRKTVTVLFADLVGSTELGSKLDPELLRGVMQDYWTTARAAVERHGGSVAKFIGDAVVGVFGVPAAREDDAVRALRAAADLLRDVERLSADIASRTGVPISVRVGINTGSAIVDVSSSDVGLMVGDVANVCARLEQAAPPGEAYVGESTSELARHAADLQPLPPLEVKGKTEPLVAFRLLSVREHADAVRPRRFSGPLVGRRRQTQQLQIAYETACEERACVLVTVLGDAGVGKSRLIEEFINEIPDDAVILRGRALPYGEGITYWPLAQALRSADPDQAWVPALANTAHADAIRVGLETITGLADAADAVQMAWAFRRYLESLATTAPVVLILDDLQWADTSVLEIVETLPDLSRDAPILVACMARPELTQVRPAWGSGLAHSTMIRLTPLPEDACRTLVDDLLGSDVPREVKDRIVNAAEGNPLFVEEVVAALVDRGLLVQQEGGWHLVGTVDEIVIPPSILAVLAARLDHLGEHHRRALQSAAVVGQVFYPEALAKVLDEDVDTLLVNLVRSDMVRPTTSDIPGVDAYAFCHLSVRAAAYESMPFAERATVHRAVSRWLDQHADGHALADLATHHLERAAHYGRELGHPDAQIAEEAVGRLRKAAYRTINVVGAHVTLALLDSALALCSGMPELLAQLRFDRARALWEGTGTVDETVRAIEQAHESALAAGSDRLLWRVAVLRGAVDLNIEPGLDKTAFRERLTEAEQRLNDLGDSEGAAEALALRSVSYHGGGSVDDALEVAEEALTAARPSRNPLTWLAVVDARLSPYMSGPRPLEEERHALADVRSALAAAGWGDDPRIAPHLAIAEQRLLAREGRLEEARRKADESFAYFDERGQSPFKFGVTRYLTEMYWYTGDLGEAEAWTRQGLALTEAMRSTSGIGQRLAYLAMIAAVRQDLDEARAALGARSEIPDANDCPISRALAPAAGGLVEAIAGDSTRSREQFAAAYESLAMCDLNNARSPILLLQSLAYEQLGDREAALATARECRDLAEWLGWAPAIEQARTRVQECEAALS